MDSKTEATDLSRMADIVVPDPVSWWPPAPGWWIVLAVLLVGAAVLILRRRSRWIRNAYRRQALRELDALPDDLSGLPTLLKRVALVVHPRPEIASLSGSAWVKFLNHTTSKPCFDRRTGTGLLRISYGSTRARTLESSDAAALVDAARRWILTHEPRKRRR